MLLASDGQLVGNTHLFKPQLDQAPSSGYITGHKSEATVGSSQKRVSSTKPFWRCWIDPNKTMQVCASYFRARPHGINPSQATLRNDGFGFRFAPKATYSAA